MDDEASGGWLLDAVDGPHQLPAGLRRKLKRLGIANTAALQSHADSWFDERLSAGEFSPRELDQIDRLRHALTEGLIDFSWTRPSAASNGAVPGVELPRGPQAPSAVLDSRRARLVSRDGEGVRAREADERLRFSRGKTRIMSSRARGSVSVGTSQMSVLPEYHVSLPPERFADCLLDFEQRASKALDRVACEHDAYFAFETFDEFPGEFPEIDGCFRELFSWFAFNPRYALGTIERSLPCSFILYVADRACELYNGKQFWDSLFEQIHIKQDIQSIFKKVFHQLLLNRSMPVFNSDDKAFYYQYTALLHGGLSERLWESLWQGLLIPAVRKDESGADQGGILTGRLVLHALKGDQREYRVTETARIILGRFSEDAVEPLLDGAIEVARDVQGFNAAAAGSSMISTHGLPDAAMRALEALQRRERARGIARPSAPAAKRAFLYLPPTSLSLDIDEGVAIVSWKPQQLPAELSGHRVEYLVAGTKVALQEVKRFARCCRVEAQAHRMELSQLSGPVDTEVRLLVPPDDEHDGYRVLSSLAQTLNGCHPGCLEFVGRPGQSAPFALRHRREGIHAKKRVAYVVLAGYKLDPGPGMTMVKTRNSVLVFDVDSGASGRVLREEDGEVVAAWSERYAVRIDRSSSMGVDEDGRDVYGMGNDASKRNRVLPRVVIQTPDALERRDVLRAAVRCGDREHPVELVPVWDPAGGMGGAVALEARLDCVETLAAWQDACVLECRAAPDSRLVLSYRFCVVPITGFGITRIRRGSEAGDGIDGGRMNVGYIAEYTLMLLSPAYSADAFGEECELSGPCEYRIAAPLRKGGIEVEIFARYDHRRHQRVVLAAAGMTVSSSRRLLDRACDRNLDLGDCAELGSRNGIIRVDAMGRCRGRRLMIQVGSAPLAFKDLGRPGSVECGVLPRVAFEADDADAGPRKAILTIWQGGSWDESGFVPAHADAEIYRFRRGFGIGAVTCVADSHGGVRLHLEVPPSRRLRFEVRKENERVLQAGELDPGEDSIVLDRQVASRLLRGRKLHLAISVPKRFGGGMSRGAEQVMSISMEGSIVS